MAKVPKKIQIGPKTFDVIVSEADINALSVELEEKVAGAMQISKQKIFLRPGEHPQFQAETLLHEVLHAQLDNFELEYKLEESIVLTLSTGLLDTFRRNPKFVRYLVDDTQ